MITVVSSVKQNYNLNKGANLKKTNQVAFTGIPISLLKTEGKISRFADEATSSIGKFFKKLVGKAELPFSKKPLVANATLKHIIGDGQGIIDIPVPEVHAAVTRILDGSNLLVPDATDLAANVVDVLATKADIANTVATGLDALATKADVVDTSHKIVSGIIEIIDKIF